MNERTISDYVLKVKGKVSLLEPIQLDHNYKITLEGSVESEKDKTEHDGTYIKYYEFEPIKVELIDELGKTIKAKDTRSNSQKFRSFMKWRYDNSQLNYEFDILYNEIYNNLISKGDELFDEAVQRLNNN